MPNFSSLAGLEVARLIRLGLLGKANTSLAALGALTHRLQNPKWLLGGPKMADRIWKGAYPPVFGHSCQLSLNKFFDRSTLSLLPVDRLNADQLERQLLVPIRLGQLSYLNQVSLLSVYAKFQLMP